MYYRYISENYSNRYGEILNTMLSLDSAILLFDNKKMLKELQGAYDALAEEFYEQTKDVVIKDGIKTIKDIKYYGNGLIEFDEGKLIGKPFDYEIEKKEITPDYDILKDGPYHIQKINSASDLMRSYLTYKLTNKNSIRIPSIPKLLSEINRFKDEFAIKNVYEDLDVNSKITFLSKYQDCYTQIFKNYVDIIRKICDGEYQKSISDWIHDNIHCNGYYRYRTNPSITVYSKLDLFRNKNGNNTNEHCYITGQDSKLNIPYMKASDVEEYVKLYNNTFNENLQTLIKHNEDDKLKTMMCQANATARTLTNEYYERVHLNAESDLYANDQEYITKGYFNLFLKYTDNTRTSMEDKIVVPYNMSYVPCIGEIFKHDKKRALEYYDEYKDEMEAFIGYYKESLDYIIEDLTEVQTVLQNIDNQDMHDWMVKRKIIAKKD